MFMNLITESLSRPLYYIEEMKNLDNQCHSGMKHSHVTLKADVLSHRSREHD
jgi:hypothetical protein